MNLINPLLSNKNLFLLRSGAEADVIIISPHVRAIPPHPHHRAHNEIFLFKRFCGKFPAPCRYRKSARLLLPLRCEKDVFKPVYLARQPPRQDLSAERKAHIRAHFAQSISIIGCGRPGVDNVDLPDKARKFFLDQPQYHVG